ncbi:hypothetical protein IEQ34_003980 [Dendrobium chrysotoxum]|uniref:Uncharacterized protein n=1 Tax=Dendrobium chrysotoxum TaxID=161865 RepID=A0AAV7HFW9_DENCH|nr:hypothetical protein IEQ34_003980 [Dendrobium chrysotoxum]
MEEMLKKLIEMKTNPATSEVRETTDGQGKDGNPNPPRGRKNTEVEILEVEDDMPPLKPLSREEMSQGSKDKASVRWSAVGSLHGIGLKVGEGDLIHRGRSCSYAPGSTELDARGGRMVAVRSRKGVWMWPWWRNVNGLWNSACEETGE